ncbi:unnamed protein product, partial [Choristocarpus tenellus]
MPRLLDPDRLQKEIDAQKKRAEALAHLSKHSCGPSEYERNVETKGLDQAEAEKGMGGPKLGDNTLEAVTVRKAQQSYKELCAKGALLQQQSQLRDGLQEKVTKGGGKSAG